MGWWKASGVVLGLVGGYSAVVTVVSAWRSPLTAWTFFLCAVGYLGFFLITAVAAVIFNWVGKGSRPALPTLSPEEVDQTSTFMSHAGDHKVAIGTPFAIAICAYAIQLNAAERFRFLAIQNFQVRLEKLIDNIRNETDHSPVTLENLSIVFYELCNDLLFLQTNDAACCLLTGDAPDAERWRSVRTTLEQVRRKLAASHRKQFQTLLKKSRHGAKLSVRTIASALDEVAAAAEESLEQWRLMLGDVEELVQGARQRVLLTTRWSI